jgi:hypothetical protein
MDLSGSGAYASRISSSIANGVCRARYRGKIIYVTVIPADFISNPSDFQFHLVQLSPRENYVSEIVVRSVPAVIV